MWKLLNKLFGWDYVNIENLATSKVSRVWTRGDGEYMVSPYEFHHWPLKDHAKNGWYRCEPLTIGAAEKIYECK